MPRNTLGDLHNHLMAQIERLSDEDLKGDRMKEEMARSKAMSGVAGTIIDNARLVLDARKEAHRTGQLENGHEWRPLLPGGDGNGS